MSDLDVLRKQYEHLTPYERAVMAMDAVSRRDESTIDALDPPSLWDAYHDIKAQLAFILLAFMATADSLRADGAAWAARALLSLEEAKREKADEARLHKGLDALVENDRRRVAWILALEALDRETGAACIAAADIFGNGHAREMLESAKGKNIDFAGELESLRDAWKAISHSIAGAPKLV